MRGGRAAALACGAYEGASSALPRATVACALRASQLRAPAQGKAPQVSDAMVCQGELCSWGRGKDDAYTDDCSPDEQALFTVLYEITSFDIIISRSVVIFRESYRRLC